MWLGRLNLRDRSVNARVVLISLGTMLVVEVASRLLLAYFQKHPGQMDAETIRALFGTVSMPPLPLFLLAAGGAATLVIAVCVRLAESFPGTFGIPPLAATGQMAFTWYVAHIILGLGGVVALDLATSQPLPVGEGVGFLFFAAVVFVSWLWKKRIHHGPLEWLLRKIAG